MVYVLQMLCYMSMSVVFCNFGNVKLQCDFAPDTLPFFDIPVSETKMDDFGCI